MLLTPDHIERPLIPWTGVPPLFGKCPGVNQTGKISSLPLVSTETTRTELLNYFNNTWTLTEVLFSGLSNRQAFYQRPYHQLRHPLIFYYGHPAVLYVNKLRVAGLIQGPVDEPIEKLFETGVDEMRWDDLHEGDPNIWPDLDVIIAYRVKVYNLVRGLIEALPSEKVSITMDSPLWALVMGFEHERIHLETSSVLMRELPLEFVRPPQAWPNLSNYSKDKSLVQNQMVSIPAGEVRLGKPKDWPSFGWDNEYGSEVRSYSSFQANQSLISNSEFAEFVQGGGYSNEKYWSKEGWGWRSFRNIKKPTFWVSDGPAGLHSYKLRTVFEVIDMPWDWPVCVNYHEAKAYCAWKSEKDSVESGYRLLTEVEHHALRDSKIQSDPIMTGSYGAEGFNFNLSFGSESSVHGGRPNSRGIYDSFGNLWQWSEDHFHALAGGAVHPYYEDFSSPCYDGKHHMIFGGSFISTGDEASIWARFHFRPHFFQHAGFRLVKSETPLQVKSPGANGNSIYQTKEMIDKYLLMHWGTEGEIKDNRPHVSWPDVVHLPQRCAELVRKHAAAKEKVLDLGCAVGRSSFELARDFKTVHGIDYSPEFIDCANKLKSEMKIKYQRKDSGNQFTELTAVVDPVIESSRITFETGDACHLPLEYQNYDAVLLANVLCRLQDPKKCLERMQGKYALVKPGGILVMTTPFSWLEDYTPKSNWVDGIAGVQKILTEFECLSQEELPFLIREHSRKFEYIITLASVWKRRS